MEDIRDSHSPTTSSSANPAIEYVNPVYFESGLEGSTAQIINATKVLVGSDISISREKSLEEFGKNGAVVPVAKVSKKLPFRKMYVAALAALIHAISMGFAVTYTATATEDMNRTSSAVRPTKDQTTWIGSLLAVGALFGGIAAGHLSNYFGRRGALLVSAVPFMGGWLSIAYAKSIEIVYCGRLITGFCCGLVSVTAPMYVVEISTPEVRGLLGASFQLFVVIGVLFVSCLGSRIHWTWLAVAGSVISLISLAVMLLVPESPRWLMAKGKVLRAKKALKFLQGEDFDADKECANIQENINSQPTGTFSLSEFSSPAVYKSAIFSLLLMFFQQFSGVNAIMFYTVSIFKSAGSSLSGNISTIIVAIVQVLATLAGSVLVDRSGRKTLLLISGACMALSLITIGIFDFATRSNPNVLRKSYGWLPILTMMFYIAAFSIGYGPIPWLMVAEMTSTRFRSAISGVATAFNWLFVFIVTKTFSDLEYLIKDYGTYWAYAVFCIISCIFTYFLLPETKGKTLDEIQEKLSRGIRAPSVTKQSDETNVKKV